MPLSEHEQRLLEQMERALYAEDPKFASALRGSDLRGRYRRRALLAGVAFLLGIAMLLGGVAAPLVPVSVLGFLVMLGSAFYAVSSWRRIPTEGETADGAPPVPGAQPAPPRKIKAKAKSRGSMMDRMEERWRRRRDGDGR